MVYINNCIGGTRRISNVKSADRVQLSTHFWWRLLSCHTVCSWKQ